MSEVKVSHRPLNLARLYPFRAEDFQHTELPHGSLGPFHIPTAHHCDPQLVEDVLEDFIPELAGQEYSWDVAFNTWGEVIAEGEAESWLLLKIIGEYIKRLPEAQRLYDLDAPD